MRTAGLWMLAVVAALMLATGLPAWVLLAGVALGFAVLGVTIGAIPPALLTSIPSRLMGLIENDLLQTLPLYVLMGAMLNRLPLAEVLFRTARRVPRVRGAALVCVASTLGVVVPPSLELILLGNAMLR